MKRMVALSSLVLFLFVAAEAPAAPPQPPPRFTPEFALDPALAERLERGEVKRGEAVDLSVTVPAPPEGVEEVLYLRPVDGEIRSAFGVPADHEATGASLPSVRIPIVRGMAGGQSRVRVAFAFAPSGRRGGGVEAELWVTGRVAARERMSVTFAVAPDQAVRVRAVGAINAAQMQELERDAEQRRTLLTADQVIPLTPEQLERALRTDSPTDSAGQPVKP